MRRQKELIHKALEGDKVIIILDALRFDAVKEAEPVWSSGSETPQWLANTFPLQYDVTYFSANPFCSSVRNPYGWRGTDHFRVVPVWDFGWKEVNGCYTVPPEEVVKAYKREGEPRPAILHFMQPHTPFAYCSNPLPIPWVTDLEKKGVVKPGDVERSKKLYPYWVKRYGAEAVREAYYEQAEYIVELALSFAKEIGDTIVTADHGEMLGEKGLWGHPPVITNELRVVPWLEVR